MGPRFAFKSWCTWTTEQAPILACQQPVHVTVHDWIQNARRDSHWANKKLFDLLYARSHLHNAMWTQFMQPLHQQHDYNVCMPSHAIQMPVLQSRIYYWGTSAPKSCTQKLGIPFGDGAELQLLWRSIFFNCRPLPIAINICSNHHHAWLGLDCMGHPGLDRLHHWIVVTLVPHVALQLDYPHQPNWDVNIRVYHKQ